MLEESEFYNNSKILSYNENIMYILGNRSAGKSFCWKEWAVKRFLNGKGQFMYIRRYDNDLDDIDTFFNDIAFKFPNVDFRVKGRRLFINGNIGGYAIPLSIGQKKKSVSFVDVTFLFFDEFLPENGRYLKNEFSKLQGLYQTVARGGGKVIRDNVYMALVANHVSYANPYFQAMKIRIRGDEKYIHVKRMNSVVELFDNKQVADEVKKSKVGGFLSYGEYGEYAQGGNFLLDSKEFIEPLPSGSEYQLTIKYDGNEYGVYSRLDGLYHIGKPRQNFRLQYAFSNKDLSLNYKLIDNWRNSMIMVNLKAYYEEGGLRFTNYSAKQMFTDIMKYTEI